MEGSSYIQRNLPRSYCLSLFYYIPVDSSLVFGFHIFTPIYPPMPETTAITANVNKYESNILINSIKLDILFPPFLQKHMKSS